MASAGAGDGMVVAPQPEAAEAGIDVLAAGGNAVDAAVAAAFVQGVVDPLQCGLGGFGSMAIHDGRTGLLSYLDFHARAPVAATPDMWASAIVGESEDGFGFVLEGQVNELGYESVCVPSAPGALYVAHHEAGALPWREVLAPAIEWAERGWPVRPGVAMQFGMPSYSGHASNLERLALSPAGRALYLRPNGRPHRMGTVVRNPDLAAVLRSLADDGVESFYTGELAHAMAADFEAHGGLLSLEDLRGCQPRWEAPVWGTYRGLRVASNQAPGGGPMLLEMLAILERFDLAAMGHNSVEYVRTVVEVMKQATVDKDRHLGDPAFVEVPVAELLSERYADEVAARIARGDKVTVPRLGADLESRNTTQLCVVDGDGSCVSLTHTLGFPSGVVTDGLGFMYNGAMASFDPRPGRAHSIAPGKARFSSIMPTIVYDGASPRFVLGGVGATQIAMGVVQVILNLVDFGRSITEAVVEPRFCATSDVVEVVNRIPHATTDALERDGYTVSRWPMSHGVAWVHGIAIGPDGAISGAADPASDGSALSVRP